MNPENGIDRVEQYTYDAAGRITETAKGAGGENAPSLVKRIRRYAYNWMDQLTAYTNAEGGTIWYHYNKNGEAIGEKRPAA